VRETQIVLALATTPEGMPLWYEVFPGNTWEGDTLRSFTCNWRNFEYQDSGGVLVADGAMMVSENLKELRGEGLNYVLGARLKKLKAQEKEQVLNRNEYIEIEENEGQTIQYRVIERGESRLLVTWSAARAKKDEHDRRRLVERLLKKLSKKKQQSLKGKAVISNRGTHRYLKIAEGEPENTYVLDEEKISLDAKWDGLHGIETDLPLCSKSEILGALSHYHSLWRIEESFRIQKSNLKIRPIYHYTQERIHAHIALCYMAFACLRQLEKRIYLQQKEHMSPETIRASILDVRSALLRDKDTGKLYRFPKRLSAGAKKLYKSLGLKRDTKPREITSLSAYRRRTQRAEEEETSR
jgi:transposase